MLHIAMINESTQVTDDAVLKVVKALNYQVHHHFASHWNVSAQIEMVPKGQSPKAGRWWIAVLDNSDQAGALGYHDLTSEDLPLGKVFAGTDLQYGLQWSVTASHELLEILGDPFINLSALDGNNSRLFAYEVADACEADALGYEVEGVLLSDFVTPEFFNPNARKGAIMDYRGHLTDPFTLAPGGYLSYLDLNDLSGGWQQEVSQQTMADPKAHFQSRPHPGSRRERRTIPRQHWIRSTAFSDLTSS